MSTSRSPIGKLPRLVRSEWVDLPVVEASGLASRTRDGRTRVAVVGDRSSHLAVGSVGPSGGIGDWTVIDLRQVDGWPQTEGDSQLEAIAIDDGDLVALMREDPPVVLVVDTAALSVRTRIALTAPTGSPLRGKWDDPSSRGEGLLFLRGGRMLVIKEKRPPALVEFAPAGREAEGVSRDNFLAPGESWDAPVGDAEFVAVAMWRLRGPAKRTLADVSDLALGSDRSLWLLSDKSRTVARLSLETSLSPSGGDICDLDEAWRLPKKTIKPEGVAALDEQRVLIAMDTKSTVRNGMIVHRPT
jgi:hypothetical protein